MVDIEDVARWLSGRSVWWPFTALALLVLTRVAVGTEGPLGVLGVPGALLVQAYDRALAATVGVGALGPADPVGLAVCCYLLALPVAAVLRTFAAAWRWRKGLLYPEEYPHY
ncbi:hypothetical protein GCM10009037_11650 [Halarchaeum grantii]|uniref:Uncharacterized protein n=1 Tax=Halarchaeum grantii TaxID=1193105 RepID=A0A830ETU8_9EURY|nr:hypothetical protein [Halarchaeum grantii]GGL29627.1 hypothetical protein GCM10009037_11650 [Halarchaeum grantii]